MCSVYQGCSSWMVHLVTVGERTALRKSSSNPLEELCLLFLHSSEWLNHKVSWGAGGYAGPSSPKIESEDCSLGEFFCALNNLHWWLDTFFKVYLKMKEVNFLYFYIRLLCISVTEPVRVRHCFESDSLVKYFPLCRWSVLEPLESLHFDAYECVTNSCVLIRVVNN